MRERQERVKDAISPVSGGDLLFHVGHSTDPIYRTSIVPEPVLSLGQAAVKPPLSLPLMFGHSVAVLGSMAA